MRNKSKPIRFPPLCRFGVRLFYNTFLQHFFEILTGIGLLTGRHLLRRTGDDYGAAPVSAVRPQIDDIIRRFYNVQIVFDDHHRIPRVYQTLQNLDQPVHIGKMKAGRRLVQDIHGLSRHSLRQFRRQFDPLRLAFDFAYGKADWGKAANGQDLTRQGWLLSGIAEYKLDYVTPGLIAWYGSGDNSDTMDGSERLPTLSPGWGAFYKDLCIVLLTIQNSL